MSNEVGLRLKELRQKFIIQGTRKKNGSHFKVSEILLRRCFPEFWLKNLRMKTRI